MVLQELAAQKFIFRGSGTFEGRPWTFAWHIAVFCLFFNLSSSIAQKDFLLSMPEENKYAFNPAYAGLESSLDVRVWGREQWSGIPGRPGTQSMVMHMPLYRLNGGGGLRILNDQLGPFQYLKIETGYDYISASDHVIWSFGVNAGINQVTFDGQKLRTVDGLYTGNIINHNDPFLPEGKLSGIVPIVSLGAYIITNSFEGGLSIQDIQLGSASFGGDEQNFDWLPKTHVNLFLEYGIDLSQDWYFYPDLFIKYDFHDLQTLIKVNAMYQDVINAGIGIRGYTGTTLESLVISAGYVIDNHFSMHYAYDLGLAGLASESTGSHEIILRYNLNKSIGKGKIPKVIGNPRYL